MISVGGVAVIGGTSGLPAGGTSADVLTGDGAWTAGGDVLHDGLATFTGSVAGRVIVGDGNGDVRPTSAAVSAVLASADEAAIASALGLPSYPAVVALTLSNGGGSHGIYITATVTVGGVAVDEAVVEFWAHYPWGTIGSFSTSIGSQVSLSNPGYAGGGTCANSTAIVRTNSSGVARVFYGGTATGGTLYASARALSPASAMATSTRTIPA